MPEFWNGGIGPPILRRSAAWQDRPCGGSGTTAVAELACQEVICVSSSAGNHWRRASAECPVSLAEAIALLRQDFWPHVARKLAWYIYSLVQQVRLRDPVHSEHTYHGLMVWLSISVTEVPKKVQHQLLHPALASGKAACQQAISGSLGSATRHSHMAAARGSPGALPSAV